MAYEFYEILEVSRDVSAEELKRAYRKKAMEVHPDRHGGDKEKETLFKEVNEAYATLSDPQKRAHYDRFGTTDMGGGFGGGQGGFHTDMDFSDIFESFFGGGFQGGGARRRTSGVEGEDIEIRVKLDFSEALSGLKKTVSYSRKVVCTECSGTGAKKGTEPKECSQCRGAGQVRRRTQTIFGVMEQTGICDMCHGTGKIIADKCTKCHGERRETQKIEKEIDIPAGIDDGMTIKVRGEGNDGIGSKAGDLYITFNIPNSIDGLTREDTNLFYTTEIDPVEAVLGIKKTLKLPVLGERVLEIKSGTQHGEVLKFKGDGMKHISKDQKGDLFITVNIKIPTHPSKKEREFYHEIAREKKIEVADDGFLNKIF
ncbi:J domain-containing protein [Candidatus Gracilibacteria bacterium]|nr:J domain-containing protein [Candidatus Gracilibacteria bacterium]PIQ11911.1 MAG: molecular chaperone DnaJ [Candidatus Gracilibacteria bacterium CG18_big_fil_WC_8_21_14_2_50_38_16]PIQ41230.1 MAG: molecular chaperone DnaJ [Candidatus Gracilibacteria bacterium CG12_big_fil_rev_8_21_14_0_65_38_15]